MNRNALRTLDMKHLCGVAAIAGLLALAGCQTAPKTGPGAAASGTRNAAASASTAGAETTGMGSGQSLSGSGSQKPQAGPESSYENRTVYFDFDKSVVKSDYFPMLKKQAQYLSDHSDARVLLEGYTDDRGTWEYNIGLGARRAAAVRQFLLLQGVNAGQLKTISYGEAYPANSADNPKAWAKNRRVVIKYLKPGSNS